MKQEKTKVTCCSTRQKIFGIIALGGLFVCGMMVGLTFNGGNTNKPTPESMTIDDECSVMEKMLLSQLRPRDSQNSEDHYYNSRIYGNLADINCGNRGEKYFALRKMESALAEMAEDTSSKLDTAERTCNQIEQLLTRNLYEQDDRSSYNHIYNAKIYANLSERGCPENSQKYVDLAKRELEIARALEDDKMDDDETIAVVETYKRIQMQNAAQEILDKAKKITDPAIDFIIQLEKIINE
ncbi:MAG: hypothetical protein IJ560_03160 [Alphaproteobacteria bacterium]|nr:hypothetical protein [Alphaproteobacteria bacterium]